jgi:hypothetical protein
MELERIWQSDMCRNARLVARRTPTHQSGTVGRSQWLDGLIDE